MSNKSTEKFLKSAELKGFTVYNAAFLMSLVHLTRFLLKAIIVLIRLFCFQIYSLLDSFHLFYGNNLQQSYDDIYLTCVSLWVSQCHKSAKWT